MSGFPPASRKGADGEIIPVCLPVVPGARLREARRSLSRTRPRSRRGGFSRRAGMPRGGATTGLPRGALARRGETRCVAGCPTAHRKVAPRGDLAGGIRRDSRRDGEGSAPQASAGRPGAARGGCALRTRGDRERASRRRPRPGRPGGRPLRRCGASGLLDDAGLSGVGPGPGGLGARMPGLRLAAGGRSRPRRRATLCHLLALCRGVASDASDVRQLPLHRRHLLLCNRGGPGRGKGRGLRAVRYLPQALLSRRRPPGRSLSPTTWPRCRSTS